MTTDFPVSIFQVVALGLVLSMLAGLLAIALARRTGLIDKPGGEPHKLHTKPTAIAGGLALFVVLVLGWFLNRREFGDLWKVLLPAAVIFAVGLWDDYRRVRFWVKLALEILAVGLLIAFGIQVHVIQISFPEVPASVAGVLDILITIVWLVGMTNAYNFVDSMDGLATGIAVITSIFLAFTSLFSGQVGLAHFMAFLAGACYGLYFFNSFPARLFLGDSGALSLGFLLATTSMLYNPRVFPQPSSWFVPVMILGVPIFDILLVVISRLRRSQPVYKADRGHTYHRLVAMGLPPNQAVLLLHIATLLLGCLAFIALNLQPVAANIIFAGVVLAGLLALALMDDRKRWP
ncbi:MAG TPA: MraY family glycosyltransferase [Anaerolineales bacterium]|jgi:UDP-GlcNAc:undecaprenyl-phosphate GlcNAc-1-phosphate transferase